MPHRPGTISPFLPLATFPPPFSLFLPLSFLYLFRSHFSATRNRFPFTGRTRTNNACGWAGGVTDKESDRERKEEKGREGQGRHNKKSRSGSVNKMPNSSTCHNLSLARCRCLPRLLASSIWLPLEPGLVQLIPYSLFVIPITRHSHTHTHI